MNYEDSLSGLDLDREARKVKITRETDEWGVPESISAYRKRVMDALTKKASEPEYVEEEEFEPEAEEEAEEGEDGSAPARKPKEPVAALPAVAECPDFLDSLTGL